LPSAINISRQRAGDRSQVPKNPPCDPIARKTLPRPPHPSPTSVTIAIRPSGGVGWREFVEMICPTGEAKYFCEWDWTAQIRLICFNKFRRARKRRKRMKCDEIRGWGCGRSLWLPPQASRASFARLDPAKREGARRRRSISQNGLSPSPAISAGRGPGAAQWKRRSFSAIATSLMLASRRRIRPWSSNSHCSLP
jgi:hypothetical protein